MAQNVLFSAPFFHHCVWSKKNQSHESLSLMYKHAS
ncbi:hypothetical protein SOVF_190940 [Spinacia oleracea]|nr:hypothetical protein SOVF_190940 [Spinacia oleracea]